MQLPCLAPLCFVVSAGLLSAQAPVYPELSSNNFFRAVSGAKHPTTNNPYPVGGQQPPGYAASPGVAAKSRIWTHTPKERIQAGTGISAVYQGRYFTAIGMTQAVQPGAAVTTYPAPNHYAHKTGIAAATASTAPSYAHATSGADLFSIADAAINVNAWNIQEISTVLTTPVPFQNRPELLLFAEYRGGEWQDDPNGGQCLAVDWQGGNGFSLLQYSGYTTGTGPFQVGPLSYQLYRPKIALLIEEATLTITGDHANNHYTPRLTGEQYRGLTGGRCDYATALNANLFFDIRAGANYSSSGAGVVLLNMGPSLFPGTIQIGGYGNLVLNPADPALDAMTGTVFTLLAGGNYNGEQTPILIPALGAAALGQWIKAQGIVFNGGLTNLQLTTASAMKVEI